MNTTILNYININPCPHNPFTLFPILYNILPYLPLTSPFLTSNLPLPWILPYPNYTSFQSPCNPCLPFSLPSPFLPPPHPSGCLTRYLHECGSKGYGWEGLNVQGQKRREEGWMGKRGIRRWRIKIPEFFFFKNWKKNYMRHVGW